jgi:hypothetical protein
VGRPGAARERAARTLNNPFRQLREPELFELAVDGDNYWVTFAGRLA